MAGVGRVQARVGLVVGRRDVRLTFSHDGNTSDLSMPFRGAAPARPARDLLRGSRADEEHPGHSDEGGDGGATCCSCTEAAMESATSQMGCSDQALRGGACRGREAPCSKR